MPMITHYSHPLPKFESGDLLSMTPDESLFVTLCHRVWVAVYPAPPEAPTSQVELWHTREEGYVVMESRKAPVAMTKGTLVPWLLAHGATPSDVQALAIEALLNKMGMVGLMIVMDEADDDDEEEDKA